MLTIMEKKRKPAFELLLWIILIGILFAIIVCLRPMFNMDNASDILTMMAACCIGCFAVLCFGLRRYFNGRKWVAFLLVLLSIPLSIITGIGMMCALNAPQIPELRSKIMDSFVAHRQDNDIQDFINGLYSNGKELVDETPPIHKSFTVAQRLTPTSPWEIVDKEQFDSLGITIDDPSVLTSLDKCLTLILLQPDKENRYVAQDFRWSNGKKGSYCTINATIIDVPSGTVYAPVYCSSAPLKPDGESLLYKDILAESGNNFPTLIDRYIVEK